MLGTLLLNPLLLFNERMGATALRGRAVLVHLLLRIVVTMAVAYFVVQVGLAGYAGYRLLHKHFLMPAQKPHALADLCGRGTWAIVSGVRKRCVGHRVAEQLVRAGFSVLLVGTREFHTAREVAADLRTTLGASHTESQIAHVDMDFDRALDEDFFAELDRELSRHDRDYSVLVNNDREHMATRMGNLPAWAPSYKQPDAVLRRTLACGTIMQCALTHRMIPRLKRRATNRSSYIVHVTAQCVHKSAFVAADNALHAPHTCVYDATNALRYFHARGTDLEVGGAAEEETYAAFLAPSGNAAPKHGLRTLHIQAGPLRHENGGMVQSDFPFVVSQATFAERIVHFMNNRLEGVHRAYWGHDANLAIVAVLPLLKYPLLRVVGKRLADQCMTEHASEAVVAPEREDEHAAGAAAAAGGDLAAAELASDAASDMAPASSDMASDVASDVASEDMKSDVASEDMKSDVASEDMKSDVASEDMKSDVASVVVASSDVAVVDANMP